MRIEWGGEVKELYKEYKGLLFSLAYQMTGSAIDAEDVVQDTFLKLNDLDRDRLDEPRAYLCKMVTNRCKDLLKSARHRKEQYIGEWLPEPIVTLEDQTSEAVIRDEQLAYAVLVMLERLSPEERAVFVLHEAIGFKYNEISSIVNKSEVNCRKINSRAREKLGVPTELNIQSETASRQWINRFLRVIEQDNVDEIISMLAEDVVLIADGGGKVTAAVQPIKSSKNVASFLIGLYRKVSKSDEALHIERTNINGQYGLIIRINKYIDSVVLFHIKNNAISNIYLVRNPDKLNGIKKMNTQ